MTSEQPLLWLDAARTTGEFRSRLLDVSLGEPIYVKMDLLSGQVSSATSEILAIKFKLITLKTHFTQQLYKVLLHSKPFFLFKVLFNRFDSENAYIRTWLRYSKKVHVDNAPAKISINKILIKANTQTEFHIVKSTTEESFAFNSNSSWCRALNKF